MDTYLDPSLGGTLGFLDSSSSLHPSSEPSNQTLHFDSFDSWLNPVSTPAYEGSQGLSVTHGAPPVAPLSLDTRSSLSSGHFGVHLHSTSRSSTSTSTPLSPLSPEVHGGSGTLHLPFVTAPEYSNDGGGGGGGGMFHSSRSNFVHPSPSTHSEPGTESMSIAMYDREIGSSSGSTSRVEPVGGDYSNSLQSLRNHSISSNASSSSSTARHTLSPSTSIQGVSRSVPLIVPSTSRQPHPPVQGQSPPTTRSRGHKPSQADESVPEAALHLLRLALPTGSTGSAATNTTGDDDRSCDEDAEGESDDTSIHSTDLKAFSQLFPDVHAQALPFETTVWNHSEGQPPLHVQRGGGPGSRRPSAASSAASAARVRQHNPARTQREASVASARSIEFQFADPRPPSTSFSASTSASGPATAIGRRNTPRARRSNVSSNGGEEYGEFNVKAESEGFGGGNDSGGEYQEGDVYEDGGDLTDTGKGKGKKKTTKGGGGGAAAKGKGKATKRTSTAADGAPPAKKTRTTTNGRATAAPRKPRRQAFLPPTLSNRTFPDGFEISPHFPRFYRSFPISSAVPPESFILQPTHDAGTITTVDSQGLPLSMLPFNFPAHSPYSASQSPPLASTSPSASTSTPTSTSNSLSNISVDEIGSFLIHDQSHANSQSSSSSSHTHPHYATTSSYSQSPYSLPPATPNPHEMAPPSLLQPPLVLSSAVEDEFSRLNLMQPPPEARWNKAGDPFNLYYPRFVKGSANDKCGLCPICSEPPERGGEGELKWFKLKNSSYVYHMSYAHGLSNVTGLPFSPPIELRQVALTNQSKDSRAQMTEGRCHKCNIWVPLLSVKNIDAIIPELIWWKHAKKCHGDTTIPGERDPHIVDDLYNFILAKKQAALLAA